MDEPYIPAAVLKITMPAMRRLGRQAYVQVTNEGDAPARLTIHTTEIPRVLDIAPHETQALVGHKLYRVEIEPVSEEDH